MNAKKLRVGWKVASLSPGIASVRYRAMLPLLALESVGVESTVFVSPAEENLDGLDVLVIVKSLAPEDIPLAEAAVARGIAVVYDLCDNVFLEGYTVKGGGSASALFLSIAGYASCIVTTTEPLAQEVRRRTSDIPVVVIPDGIETVPLTLQITERLRRAEAREAARRPASGGAWRHVRKMLVLVQEEGIGSAPRLLRKLLYRSRNAAAGHLRARLEARRHRAAARQRARREPAVEGHSDVRTILWFGNHGAPYARFGILDILEYREALETLAGECPVQLVVISNHEEKYEKHIRSLRIPSRYVEWSPQAVAQWLQKAAVAIVPNTLDPFSLCKSANRTVLALSHGVPVVATPTPALEPLAQFVHLGAPLDGLRACMVHPEQARAQAQQGYRLAEELFGQPALARAWLQVVEDTPVRVARGADSTSTMAVVLHLVQDLDLALPILRAARRKGVDTEAWCSASLLRNSPRVLASLRSGNFQFRVLPDQRAPVQVCFPPAMRVLLTVAETNLNPHRFQRGLTEAAARAGLLVGTLQHGFENVGLTYEDAVQSLDKVDIAAHRIYTWGPPDSLHPRLDAGVRTRCVAVGCPKDVHVDAPGIEELLPSGRTLVGVFENLHWHRYSEDYRQAFVANMLALAREFPQVVFVVKPHHAGLWLTKRYDGEQPAAPNLLIADPQTHGWERYTATALLGRLQAVITTPSTVALDAARQALPVAVVASGLDLPAYEPLPLLEAPADWRQFLASALDQDARAPLVQRSCAFVSRVLLPGDAAGRIVEDLLQVAGAEVRKIA